MHWKHAYQIIQIVPWLLRKSFIISERYQLNFLYIEINLSVISPTQVTTKYVSISIPFNCHSTISIYADIIVTISEIKAQVNISNSPILTLSSMNAVLFRVYRFLKMKVRVIWKWIVKWHLPQKRILPHSRLLHLPRTLTTENRPLNLGLLLDSIRFP